MGGFYRQYLEALCRRRGWTDPSYEVYRDTSGYTCLVIVNGREYQTDLSYESDVLAQENAAMRAFMVCRNFSVNGGMLARNGIVSGLPAAGSSSRKNNSRHPRRQVTCRGIIPTTGDITDEELEKAGAGDISSAASNGDGGNKDDGEDGQGQVELNDESKAPVRSEAEITLKEETVAAEKSSNPPTAIGDNARIDNEVMTDRFASHEDEVDEQDEKAATNHLRQGSEPNTPLELSSRANNNFFENLAPATNAGDDSGYASLPNAKSTVNQHDNHDDDDNMSVGSILTNASRVLLPQSEREHLISEFAGDLQQDIGLGGDGDARERLSSRLPDLLKSYSMRLEEGPGMKQNRDAKEFIRQQRNFIARRFRESHIPEGLPEDEDHYTQTGDGMSLVEKMALWNISGESAPVPTDDHIDEAYETQPAPRYQDARPFLLHGPAYRWLLENARSSALLTERSGTVLESITRQLDDIFVSAGGVEPGRSQVLSVIFNLDWEIPSFVKSLNCDAVSDMTVDRVITMTECGGNTQALTCADYMRQVWPSSGYHFLCMVQEALKSPRLSSAGRLFDGTEIKIMLGPSKTSVTAHGSRPSLTELGEQLAWLGAALRVSPVSRGICLSTAAITASWRHSSRKSLVTVQLSYNASEVTNDQSTGVDGTCWHAMFCNPTIASGFPILARHKNEQGLEVPFDLMSNLAKIQFITRYQNTLILKGFCTMLVPTARTDNSITWHFLLNEDGERIPYYSFREGCAGSVTTEAVNTNLIEAGGLRNFVGWASKITRHLGTEDIDYDEIDWAGARECSAGLAIEQKLTISASKVIGLSGSFIRGCGDKPEYIKQPTYRAQIASARKMCVVLYDTEAQRGWLVDGASALLHLVRTQVVREPFGGEGSFFDNLEFNSYAFKHPEIDAGPNAAADCLRDDDNIRHAILREFVSYEDEKVDIQQIGKTAVVREVPGRHQLGNLALGFGENTKAIYKTTCLKDLVSQAWSTLEQIHDRQVEHTRTHNTKQLPSSFETKLEGYEFMDIISGEHTLTRRAVPLKSNGATWVALAKQLDAIVLFGQQFGEIYKPAEEVRSHICKEWMSVPRGHEYLAASVSLLQEIRQHSCRKGRVDPDTPELVKGFFFSPSADAFSHCGSSCGHMLNRVQQLRLTTRGIFGLSRNRVRGVDSFAETEGAILFGEKSDLEAERLERQPLSEIHESSFHDSGIGSSIQISSLIDSSATSHSSFHLTPSSNNLTAASTQGQAQKRGWKDWGFRLKFNQRRRSR